MAQQHNTLFCGRDLRLALADHCHIVSSLNPRHGFSIIIPLCLAKASMVSLAPDVAQYGTIPAIYSRVCRYHATRKVNRVCHEGLIMLHALFGYDSTDYYVVGGAAALCQLETEDEKKT